MYSFCGDYFWNFEYPTKLPRDIIVVTNSDIVPQLLVQKIFILLGKFLNCHCLLSFGMHRSQAISLHIIAYIQTTLSLQNHYYYLHGSLASLYTCWPHVYFRLSLCRLEISHITLLLFICITSIWRLDLIEVLYPGKLLSEPPLQPWYTHDSSYESFWSPRTYGLIWSSRSFQFPGSLELIYIFGSYHAQSLRGSILSSARCLPLLPSMRWMLILYVHEADS